ncbi:MAG: hypothetical protein ACLPZR_03435, partial [Solirubrobacteraceae bacterium]
DNGTSISGATASTYTLQASDVGHTLDVVVTATNSAGSANATSSATASVTASSGGLPGGVALQQVDGGPDYWGQWSNSFPTSSSFYPIGVFNQSLGYNNGNYDPTQIAAYKAEGINTFINLYNGYNSSLLSAIQADGMSAIVGPLAPSYAGNAISGYVWFDEADGGNDCGDVPSASVLGVTVSCSPTSSGRTPTSVISQVNADLHSQDSTRPDYCQYTKPVAEDSGLSSSQAAAYETAGCNIVSYDSYVQNDSYANNHDLWRQYDDVVRTREQDGENSATHTPGAAPVWPFIEAGEPFSPSQWDGLTITPPMDVAEAWNAVIGGAQGIQWFDHDFGNDGQSGYNTSGDDLIDSGEDSSTYGVALQTDIKQFDDQVEALAPVLNSETANGYVTATNPNPDSEDGVSVNTLVKYDAATNDFYVFVAPTATSSESITFNVAGGYSGSVTDVKPESGTTSTVTATNGSFTDTFSGQTDVHYYIIPNS